MYFLLPCVPLSDFLPPCHTSWSIICTVVSLCKWRTVVTIWIWQNPFPHLISWHWSLIAVALMCWQACPECPLPTRKGLRCRYPIPQPTVPPRGWLACSPSRYFTSPLDVARAGRYKMTHGQEASVRSAAHVCHYSRPFGIPPGISRSRAAWKWDKVSSVHDQPWQHTWPQSSLQECFFFLLWLSYYIILHLVAPQVQMASSPVPTVKMGSIKGNARSVGTHQQTHAVKQSSLHSPSFSLHSRRVKKCPYY